MNFTLQELYDFANVSAPGGNHYTSKAEIERVWNTEKGKKLSSFVDPNSFYQHFIMVHIYGNMAQRYSGVFDTRELYIVEGDNRLKEFYDFLELSTFPFGYKFQASKEHTGYKLLIKKDEEMVENLNARIGIEYYSDIPDKVHRPPYTIKPSVVEGYLSCSLEDYKRKMRNKEMNKKALEQLRRFEIDIQLRNIKKFVKKIESYEEVKIREIHSEIRYQNETYYDEDGEEYNFDEYSKEQILSDIYDELCNNSYYDWSKKIIMQY
jgi:hypothetical protein